MDVSSAFIYGIVAAVMGGNLIYMLVDLRRMAKESKRLDKMGKDIMTDIEIGRHYIEIAANLTERIEKLEEKANTPTKETVTVKAKNPRNTKKTKEA